jgi:hypothetical protein
MILMNKFEISQRAWRFLDQAITRLMGENEVWTQIKVNYGAVSDEVFGQFRGRFQKVCTQRNLDIDEVEIRSANPASVHVPRADISMRRPLDLTETLPSIHVSDNNSEMVDLTSVPSHQRVYEDLASSEVYGQMQDAGRTRLTERMPQLSGRQSVSSPDIITLEGDSRRRYRFMDDPAWQAQNNAGLSSHLTENMPGLETPTQRFRRASVDYAAFEAALSGRLPTIVHTTEIPDDLPEIPELTTPVTSVASEKTTVREEPHAPFSSSIHPSLYQRTDPFAPEDVSELGQAAFQTSPEEVQESASLIDKREDLERQMADLEAKQKDAKQKETELETQLEGQRTRETALREQERALEQQRQALDAEGLTQNKARSLKSKQIKELQNRTFQRGNKS